MDKAEKFLQGKHNEIDALEIPGDLEMRLRNALENRTVSSHKLVNRWVAWAAVFMIVFLAGYYHFDALAYYGKKLMGYNTVMTDTMQELNEKGQGQLIGKSSTTKNGVTVTLDGIMLDENQLLAFYTVKGADKDANIIYSIKTASNDYLMSSGCGEKNDVLNETKYVGSFLCPKFYEKKLVFEFIVDSSGRKEVGEIPFQLDRSKAMGYILKKPLAQSVRVDETDIEFNSISASPTTTIITGTIRGIFTLAADQIKGKRFRPINMDIRLIANGKEVPIQGGGTTTDLHGMTFQQNYDALPIPLKTLELKLVSFSADHDVRKKIKLEKGKSVHEYSILGQSIVINNILETDDATFITITTEDSVRLTQVALLADNMPIELLETKTDKKEEDANGNLFHTRTLNFPGRGEDLVFDIKSITYSKKYDKAIRIPVY